MAKLAIPVQMCNRVRTYSSGLVWLLLSFFLHDASPHQCCCSFLVGLALLVPAECRRARLTCKKGQRLTGVHITRAHEQKQAHTHCIDNMYIPKQYLLFVVHDQQPWLGSSAPKPMEKHMTSLYNR